MLETLIAQSLFLTAGASLVIICCVALPCWRIATQQKMMRRRVEALETRRSALLRDHAGETIPSRIVPVGLEAGTKAPHFSLPDASGEVHSVDTLCSSGGPVFLLFVEPGCGPCEEMQVEARKWQESAAKAATFVFVGQAAPKASVSSSPQLDNGPVTLLQHDREVLHAYGVPVVPGAVLVRPDRTIGSQIALGRDAIRSLAKKLLDETTR
jgi:hypothetical protein